VDRTIKRPVSRKRALEIIGNYPASRVLVLGDLMVDHFIWGKVSRISPEAPVPVVEVTKENLMMGGSGNVVNNIHAIGATWPSQGSSARTGWATGSRPSCSR